VRTLSLISPAVPDIRRFRAHPLRSDPRVAALVVPGLGGYAMRKASAIPVETRVKATFALCFADPSRCSPTRLVQTIEDAQALSAKSWANRGFLRSLRGLARSQFLQPARGWATMRAVTAPTLVLWGDADRLVAPDLAAPVAEAIPGACLLVLPGIGHTAMMEDPVTTARAILGLVEDSATAPAPG
jgi:pimeloyl-ACP methyl ester carboxylesterase